MRLYRVSFVSGFGLGYVLGAQAGRERYEQMRRLARRAVESPAVQQAAGMMQAQATAAARAARDLAAAGVRKGVSTAGQHWPAADQQGPSAPESGNGSGQHRTEGNAHRPFVPVNGSFGGHDLI